jgi:hypothetical protein
VDAPHHVQRRVLRDHDCTVCTETVELADAARSERRLYELDDVAAAVTAVYRLEAVEPDDPSEYWQVFAVLERPEIRVLDDRGDEVDVLPATSVETELRLASWHGQWYVLEWFEAGRAAA